MLILAMVVLELMKIKTEIVTNQTQLRERCCLTAVAPQFPLQTHQNSTQPNTTQHNPTQLSLMRSVCFDDYLGA